MKILVFAHTPPPHHGQSAMVKLMIDGFGGDWRKRKRAPAAADQLLGELGSKRPFQDTVLAGAEKIQCYHVNTQYSADLADMGAARFAKGLLVFRYCLEAIWCRFRFGVDTLYFAPAPPKWPALYRDWLVMAISRPFFRRVIHHWHAVGIADWQRQSGNRLTRWLTCRLLGKASLGLALAIPNLRDALWLETKRVEIVPNGIPDSFPDFETIAAPLRNARLEVRRRLICGLPIPNGMVELAGTDARVFRILYLGYCLREKGIFEMLEGLARAQTWLRAKAHPLSLHLTVAGDFASAEDRAEFMQRIAQPDLSEIVRCTGFLDELRKKQLLMESDCLCFPTYCDSFGLVVLEAMAAGMNVIATTWGALPEILPPNYPGFVPIRNSEAIAEAIPRLFVEDSSTLRTIFLERFTDRAHLARLQAVLLSLERDS